MVGDCHRTASAPATQARAAQPHGRRCIFRLTVLPQAFLKWRGLARMAATELPGLHHRRHVLRYLFRHLLARHRRPAIGHRFRRDLEHSHQRQLRLLAQINLMEGTDPSRASNRRSVPNAPCRRDRRNSRVALRSRDCAAARRAARPIQTWPPPATGRRAQRRRGLRAFHSYAGRRHQRPLHRSRPAQAFLHNLVQPTEASGLLAPGRISLALARQDTPLDSSRVESRVGKRLADGDCRQKTAHRLFDAAVRVVDQVRQRVEKRREHQFCLDRLVCIHGPSGVRLALSPQKARATLG
jgi:hypothetical protein